MIILLSFRLFADLVFYEVSFDIAPKFPSLIFINSNYRANNKKNLNFFQKTEIFGKFPENQRGGK